MQVFQLKNKNLEITEEALLVPCFKKLWDKNQNESLNVFKYIYLVLHYDSPYAGYTLEQRKQKVCFEIWGKDRTFSKDEQAAYNAYEEILNQNPTIRLYTSVKGALDKLSDYLDSVDFTEVDSKNKPVYDIRQVIAAIEKAASLMQALESLKDKVDKQKFESNRIKANKRVNPFEE